MRKDDLSGIELLAPAGNMASALAAFDAGADAVYCGLKKFNARDRSENFTPQEMSKLIAYAHKNGKKVHITFNTLIKEPEIPAAAEELSMLADMGPDAVIVQDIGILAMIRDFFPSLTIHASTQMGFHNSAGLELASKTGAKRVILERQVTLDEINKMTDYGNKLPLELEVFVHGALCCCLSGSCLFSSWSGGWSGNRGKCKQPCRRQYFNAGDAGRKQGEFLFSPDDLCAIDLLEDFRKAGVCSFKIEGRLRRADYVSKVVSAYRLLMDSRREKRVQATEDAKNILRGTYTRKLSLGFYTDVSTKGLVRCDEIGGSGLYCGRVTAVRPDGFTASLAKRLHVGDTIRVQGLSDSGDGTTLSVLSIRVNDRPAMKAFSGDQCFIRTDKKVTKDSLIYKTGESCSDYAQRIASMPTAKIPLNLDIRLSRKSISAEVKNLPEKMRWQMELNLEEAAKNPLQNESVIKEFSATASERFALGETHVAITENPFVPASELKKIRRAFWQWAEAGITEDMTAWRRKESLRLFSQCYFALKQPELKPFQDCTALQKCEKNNTGTATARAWDEIHSPDEEVILPCFTTEDELKKLESGINDLIRRGSRIFRVTSLFHFELLKNKAVTIRTCFPLPLTNSLAIRECQKLGASGAQAWIELGKEELLELRKRSVLPLELYVYGRPFLFSTRAALRIREREISDIRNNRFFLRKDGKLTCILPDRPMKIEWNNHDFSRFIDLRNAVPGEAKTSDFNFNRGLS